MAALTEKDRNDLAFALDQQVDWIALSFVQRPEDVAEARRLIGGRAALLAKIEKPAAIERLEGILELADAVMVARGDLGVELPPEDVPPLQKRIVEAARRMGRPVVVATQMLESMITSPSPTRAEVSDVATAVYDGADAIMLSAESASGQWPRESVAMMNRIATSVESDPSYQRARPFHRDACPIRPPPTPSPQSAEQDGRDRRRGGDRLLHQLGLDRAARRARAADGAAAGADPVARRPRGGSACCGARMRCGPATSPSFEEMVAKAKRMALRHGAGQGGRADHRHRRRAVRHPGIDQRHPCRPARRAPNSTAVEGA